MKPAVWLGAGGMCLSIVSAGVAVANNSLWGVMIAALATAICATVTVVTMNSNLE